MNAKWDGRLLGLANHVSTWSKDPSTKVGAVITRGNRIVSVGYNGFPQGVKDHPGRYEDREMKYKIIVHAERNAIIFAAQDLTGCTLYTTPFMPCSTCAGIVIQSGIKRVVAPELPGGLKERWGKDVDIAQQMFFEAGVELYYV
jgi:dCMP deaminase